MTFIQPHKQFNALNIILGALVFSTVLTTFALVAVYNGIVNVSHNIAAAKAELDTVGAQSTSLQNHIVALMGSGAVAEAAQTDGLVEDKNPQYLPAASGAGSITMLTP
jgi:cell division protein FtsB